MDLRRANLKIMSRREVSQHMRIPRSSKYPGVSYNESLDTWQVHMGEGQQVKCIGQFKSDEEEKAYQADLEAVNELNQGKN
ncbi:MAG: hypothetical protein ACLPHE_09530 [Methanobacterium sp.]